MIRFDPWWFSNTGELLTQFFVQLGDKLEQGSTLPGVKDRLVRYGRLTAAPAGALADFLGAAGVGSIAARGLDALLANLQSAQESRQQDVRQLRAGLEEDLGRVERGVVVVIDDIDRLSGEEIRDVFKLVKATANFPNTRYLLAFDRPTVARALYEVQKTDGNSYLQKIVQIPFTLPEPSPGQLGDLLLSGIEEIVRQQEVAVSEDELTAALEKFEYYRYEGLDEMLESLRQVKRFLSTLRFALPPVAGEVKLSDFLILEMARMFAPESYDRLLARQGLLVGVPGHSGWRDAREENEEISAAAADVSAAAKGAGSAMLDRWLQDLFPRVEAAKRNVGWSEDFQHRWTAEKRVCMPDFFEAATRWGLAPGGISEKEIRALLAYKDDPAALRERMLAYRGDDRQGVDLTTLLRRLGAWYRTNADAGETTNLLRAALGVEGFADAQTTLYVLGVDMLGKLADSAGRRDLLLEALGRHGASTTMVDLVHELGREHGYNESNPLPEESRLLSTEDFGKVERKLVVGIVERARDRSVLEQELFDRYFYVWEDISGTEAPAECLAAMVADGRLFTDLLGAYVIRSDPAHYGSVRQSLSQDPPKLKVRLLEYFELDDEALERAEVLLREDPEWLSEERRSLLEAFVNHHAAEKGAG